MGLIDVGKDLLNGVGYILKAINMQNQPGVNMWELGFIRFLGIYTLGAMFYPLPANVVMFNSLLKDQPFRQKYVLLSILLSPFVGIIR